MTVQLPYLSVTGMDQKEDWDIQAQGEGHRTFGRNKGSVPREDGAEEIS